VKTRIKPMLTENISYKIVSLFISVILWLTILGRRDFSLTKSVDVELMPAPNQIVISQSVETVKVKVAGPRTALKKFMESGLSQLVTIDVSKLKEGEADIEVPAHQIDLPFGVKVISIKPASIRAKISRKEN
jgi:YbbR domain-containing protein